MLYDRGLLNLVWHKKGFPPAKCKLGGVYSFLAGSRFKTKQSIYFTQCRVMDVLAAGYALVGAKSLWLQKGTGQTHRKNIPWELWWSPPTPQICKLKPNESWESRLPKVVEVSWCICLVIILFHRNRILDGRKLALSHGALCSTFIQHCKLESHREIYFYKSSCKTRSSVDMWLSLLVVG